MVTSAVSSVTGGRMVTKFMAQTWKRKETKC